MLGLKDCNLTRTVPKLYRVAVHELLGALFASSSVSHIRSLRSLVWPSDPMMYA
jgi:hypothetical protein